MATVKMLRDYAHCRAGDKGDISNICVIAYTKEDFEVIRMFLTPEIIKRQFMVIAKGPVERYELPQLNALNFVLHDSLNGGVTKSLALDIHGKTYSSALLMLPVTAKDRGQGA